MADFGAPMMNRFGRCPHRPDRMVESLRLLSESTARWLKASMDPARRRSARTASIESFGPNALSLQAPHARGVPMLMFVPGMVSHPLSYARLVHAPTRFLPCRRLQRRQHCALRSPPPPPPDFHAVPQGAAFFGATLRSYGAHDHDDYLRLFHEAKPGQRIGEASTWYLYSTSAAARSRSSHPTRGSSSCCATRST